MFDNNNNFSGVGIGRIQGTDVLYRLTESKMYDT